MKLKNVISVLLLIIFFMSQFYNNSVQAQDTTENVKDKTNSLFMWGLDNIDYTSLDNIIEYLNINTIYAGRSDTSEIRDFNSYQYKLLFAFSQQKNLDTYIIYDEKYIQQDQNLIKIKELIDQIYEYNQNSEYKLLGISIDSEFHTTEEYKNATEEERVEMFKSYVDSMKNAYLYAKTKQLKLVACIPTWYDLLDEQQLENLMKDGCDYIQLMNYEKENMIQAISKEMEIAKKYNKPIESIAELQKTGFSEVTEDITFYYDGIEACISKFEEISQEYQYDFLTFSYHYYNPVKELAENVIDLTNKFNYELYPKDINGNSINLKTVYLIHENERIDGVNLFYPKSEEYILYFYGVEYGKSYELIIEDELYYLESSKEVVYQQSDSRTNYDEVYCKMKEIQTAPLSFSTVLNADKTNLNPGNIVTVTASISEIKKNDENGLMAISGKLEYDTDVLEIDLNSITGLGDWNFMKGDFNQQNFKFIADSNKYVKEAGDIFKITFKVKENASLGETVIQLNSITGGTGGNTNGIVSANDAQLHFDIQKNKEDTITSTKYVIEDELIYKILPSTTVSQFKENVQTTSEMVFTDVNGKILTDTDMIGTGTKLKVGANLKYELVVIGDLDSDGIITVNDIARIKLHCIDLKLLTGSYLKAAELDNDGNITVNDLALMKLIVIGLVEL